MPSIKRAILFTTFLISAQGEIDNQTVILSANSNLALDSGAAAASGGDLRWTGSTLVPQGNAKAYLMGNLGDGGFPLISQATLTALIPVMTSSSIPAASLPVGEVIAVQTNGGNVSKVEVTAIGASITLKFTTFGTTTAGGGGGGAPAPTITAVLNNSSRIPSTFPNYGIAPSSLFVVQGTGLADPGVPVLQDSTQGLQTTLNNASISVTVGGTTTHPALYYTSPTQLAAVLPAATPVGAGSITVSYKGVASAAFPIKVVPSALGFTTFNGSALATDAVTGSLLTYTQSGKPGQIIIFWSTGLGADPSDSDTTYTSTPHQVNVNLQLFIGGAMAQIAYQGASVYPGVSVIGATIPDNVQLGCYVAVAAVTGSVVSNVATLPISTDGGVCKDPYTGLDGSQITNFGGSATFKQGSVGVFQSTSVSKSGTNTFALASASVLQLTGNFNASAPAPGGCLLAQTTSNLVTKALDAGTITVAPPGGSATSLPAVTAGEYSIQLGSAMLGGTYQFQATGGTQVGSFTATVTVPSPAVVWTNATTTVNRSSSLQITWSGGQPGTFIDIVGGSGNGSATGGFVCLAHAEDGSFTVPNYILLGLPAGQGNISLINNVYGGFSANGLDSATTIGSVSYEVAAITFN